MTTSRALAAIPLALLASCSAFGVRGGDYRVYDTASGERVELQDSVDRLGRADVVFLGEEHDNARAHELELWTFRALLDRRADVVLSMEQFESDVQPVLDAYLRGEIDEERFLAESRPWPNYRDDYRPLVELAKERGIPVVAANVPRPLAARVSRSGYWSAAGERDAPWGLKTDDPLYRARFEEAMGGHGGMEAADMDRWFAAQCMKDQKMAESIAAVFERSAPARPLVVHVCGKFHSDRRLGTVSRLAQLRPDLALTVVTTSSGSPLGRPLEADERLAADFVWRVPSAD